MSGTAASGQAGGAVEFSGKSIEEATAEGLRRLGLRAEEAHIEIVSRGSRGLFGIGSEPAVVRIRPRAGTPEATPLPPPAPVVPPVPPLQRQAPVAAPAQPAHAEPVPAQPSTLSTSNEPAAPLATPAPTALPAESGNTPTENLERDTQVAAMASEMLATLVRLMGFDGTVSAEWRDADAITDDRHLLLGVHGPNLSALIGRRGETLENIQYLLRLMVNQKMHRWLNIIVDVEDYRAKRVEHLTHLALRMAEQVASTGRSFALEPMPPNERRIIHLALRDHPTVFTESTGDSERRKVNIFLKK